MQEFNLEYQYQLYLKRMALTEAQMHPQQKKQLRQAFFGACGQILILLRDDLNELDEDTAVDTLQSMHEQVGNYWLSETNQHN